MTPSGVLINFAKDLPSKLIAGEIAENYFSCLILKLTAYVLIILTIALALWVLLITTGDKVILPSQLLEDEWNLADEEVYLTALIQYLEKETLLALDQLRNTKASKLDWAIRLLATAVVLLGIEQIIVIVFS